MLHKAPHEGGARSYSKLSPLDSDIEIARWAKLEPVDTIAMRLGLKANEVEPYGSHKAKINARAYRRLEKHPEGKLILVTAMTPTPAGEGKTVTSIGLSQAIEKLKHRQMLALREPSLGPTFGLKGGAAGGGHAQVLPMEDINMHFTGDMHAVTTAHNLLAAVVDNHVFHGNALKIDPEKIVWRRVVDLCDRQLRQCDIGLGSKFDGFPHRTGFDITASSEIMDTLSLATDLKDLKSRLERIVVAYNKADEPIYAGQLNVVGAMMVLLKDAINPNLVQTTENTPALIHCGPFGNIAHGCNSVRATHLALKLADYVVTEAGFAADLGAEKFINIKCRLSGLKPAIAVLVATCRALKMHGGIPKEQIEEENRSALDAGLANLRIHIENLKKFHLPVVVAVNRFPSDTPAELDAVFDFCDAMKTPAALSEVTALGGDGVLELAEKVLSLIDNDDNADSPLHTLYDVNLPIKEKIETIAREIYRADGVDYHPLAEENIKRLERQGLNNLPVCMAKTQFSISDDPKKLGAPTDWRLTVRDIKISNAAGYLVAITGKMLLMPGMPKHAAIEKIGIDDDGNIYGLS